MKVKNSKVVVIFDLQKKVMFFFLLNIGPRDRNILEREKSMKEEVQPYPNKI